MAGSLVYDIKIIEQPSAPFYGASGTYATDFDNFGRVFGYYNDSYYTGYPDNRGFVYENGFFTTTEVVTSAPVKAGFQSQIHFVGNVYINGLVYQGTATGSNAEGDFVGYYYTDQSPHSRQAFVFEDGRFANVVARGVPIGINDDEQIVGNIFDASSGYHAFVASPLDTLLLRISEDGWREHPDAQFILKVDGVQVGEVNTVTASHGAGQTQNVILTGHFREAHQISVVFLNDQYGHTPDKDVNLYVDSVSLNGVVQTGSEAKIDPGAGMTVGSSAELTHNGSATFDVTPKALVVHVSEDAWDYHPDAQFALIVDGKQVGEVQSVAALHAQGQSDTFSFKGDFSQAHQVAVQFLNDQYGGTNQDVNLYVDSISLNGRFINGSEAVLDAFSGTHAGTSAELFRNGSAVFNVDDLHHVGMLM